MVPFALVTVATLAAVPIALATVVVGLLVFVSALLVSTEARERYWRRGKAAIRAALGVAVAVAVPGFVSAVSTIV